MKTLDPGHFYALAHLDGEGTELLRFVKRVGDNFPGNQPPAYEGTTSQEVIRALLERQRYVEGQQPCGENQQVIYYLQRALRALEVRAARVRKDTDAWRLLDDTLDAELEAVATCPVCGHLYCNQERHA